MTKVVIFDWDVLVEVQVALETGGWAAARCGALEAVEEIEAVQEKVSRMLGRRSMDEESMDEGA